MFLVIDHNLNLKRKKNKNCVKKVETRHNKNNVLHIDAYGFHVSIYIGHCAYYRLYITIDSSSLSLHPDRCRVQSFNRSLDVWERFQNVLNSDLRHSRTPEKLSLIIKAVGPAESQSRPVRRVLATTRSCEKEGGKNRFLLPGSISALLELNRNRHVWNRPFRLP